MEMLYLPIYLQARHDIDHSDIDILKKKKKIKNTSLFFVISSLELSKFLLKSGVTLFVVLTRQFYQLVDTPVGNQFNKLKVEKNLVFTSSYLYYEWFNSFNKTGSLRGK